MNPAIIAHSELYKKPWLINIAAVLMIIFLVGMMVVDKIPSMNHLNRGTGALLILIYLLNLFRQPHKMPVEFVLILIFLFWAAITGIGVASDKTLFLNAVRTMSQLWVMMVAVGGLTLISGGSKRGFAAVIIADLVLAGYVFVTGENVAAQSGTRVAGIVSNSNGMAQDMLMGAAALLYFWEEIKSKNGKIILVGLFAIMAIMIIYSGSRKGFLCLLLLGMGWIWYCYRRFMLRNFKVMLLVVSVLLLGVFFARYVIKQTPLGKRFATAESAAEGRYGLYQDGYKMLSRSPVAGVGLDNFRIYSRGGFEAHSSYMEILADTGIVGFCVYFSLFMTLWLKCNRIIGQTDEPAFLYSSGLCKAFILMLLALSLGSPTFKSAFPCFTLAIFVGELTALERRLKASDKPTVDIV